MLSQPTKNHGRLPVSSVAASIVRLQFSVCAALWDMLDLSVKSAGSPATDLAAARGRSDRAVTRATTEPEADERQRDLLPQSRRHSRVGRLLLGSRLRRGRKRAGVCAKDREQRQNEGGRAKERNAHNLLHLVPKAAVIGRLASKTWALIGQR